MCDACPPHPCPCTTSPSREAAMVTVKPGVWCDPCIASLVAALNYSGIETVASCCGHGEQDGRIDLADGRTLRVEAPAPPGVWCYVDECPASICEGPHIEHTCSGQGGDLVTLRMEDYPCRFCGEPVTGGGDSDG